MKRRRRCLALTRRGDLCQNYADTCPIPAHRTRSASFSKPSAVANDAIRDAIGTSAAASATPKPLADDASLFEKLVEHASTHYGLSPRLIISDYWLIRTLHAWVGAVGDGYVTRRYPNPELSGVENRVGRFIFGGGTSLSAAWGITERWSEDIDLTLSPTESTTSKHFRQACQQAFGSTALSISATHNVTDKGPSHCFASFLRGQRVISRIDVTSQPLNTAPVWTQRETVMSMIGRMCDDEMLDAHPELGGFKIDTLGPGTTAMNKLLAQTQTCSSGDLEYIKERARDVYDLACIAINKDLFEGHIGRDSKALLHLSESWLPQGNRKRPADGFASLRSFDPTTREYEALAEGYETVTNGMVWGDTVPLDEAIRLAVSLDPGPSEPLAPPEPNPQVAYPRH